METIVAKEEAKIEIRIASTRIIRWINSLTFLLGLAILGLGIWLATRHGECEKFLTAPVFIIGTLIVVVSLLGFIGTWFAFTSLLYLYLVVMFFLILLLAALTIFAFVVTAKGGGHTVPGQRFEEYRLGDYSNWLQNQLKDSSNWRKLRSCLGSSKSCTEIYTDYQTVDEYQNADLNPIQSGCCRPPSECGYTIISPVRFDTGSSPQSSDPDCDLYSNDPSIKCYNCNSCRAGVAQQIKKDWHIAGIVCIILLVLLIGVYMIGCAAGRYAYLDYYSRV